LRRVHLKGGKMKAQGIALGKASKNAATP